MTGFCNLVVLHVFFYEENCDSNPLSPIIVTLYLFIYLYKNGDNLIFYHDFHIPNASYFKKKKSESKSKLRRRKKTKTKTNKKRILPLKSQVFLNL